MKFLPCIKLLIRQLPVHSKKNKLCLPFNFKTYQIIFLIDKSTVFPFMGLDGNCSLI